MATPLEDAHVRNQHVVQELRALRAASGGLFDYLPDYANYYPKLITNLQRVYERLLVAIDALQFIGLEGVQAVTLRSRTETLSWEFDRSATGVADALLQCLRDQLDEVEQRILEAKARLAGELTGGTAEEWHHENIHALALLLEAVPQL